MKNKLYFIFTSLFAFCVSFAYAASVPQLVMQRQGERRLIEFSPTERRWLTEEEINELIHNKVHFMDVTEYYQNQDFAPVPTVPDLPPALTQKALVSALFSQIDQEAMRAFLQKFTSFTNRYYNSHGLESAEYLFNVISDIASKSAYEIKVSKFEHSWKQPSIIARFEPYQPDDDNIVIVSAHQDSINHYNRMEGRAPGADDDGSGTTSVLEAFKVLAQTNIHLRRPIEFHWYSAEEVGLWGSQAVSQAYLKEGKSVYAMIQNDMTGFVDERRRHSGGPHIGLVFDYTSPELTEFVRKLITEYSSIPFAYTQCGYACSDHASWKKLGYRSAFVMEGTMSELNGNIHNPRDVISNIDFGHAAEFTKVALGFAIELVTFKVK